MINEQHPKQGEGEAAEWKNVAVQAAKDHAATTKLSGPYNNYRAGQEMAKDYFASQLSAARQEIDLLRNLLCTSAGNEFLLRREIEKLEAWVNDLQSGMYVNCVYCGHRYGKQGEVPESMADILKRHIETCPKHPMSELKAENVQLQQRIKELENNVPGAQSTCTHPREHRSYIGEGYLRCNLCGKEMK